MVDTFATLRRERKGVEMGQGRRQLTDEFKREAVGLLASSGRPLIQIASELGISPLMLRNWRNGSGGRDAGAARRPIPASARIPSRTRRPSSPGFAARTIACGWSATF
jgi:transposase